MLVEADVVAALRAPRAGSVARVYAAACAERMAQIFTGLRAGAPGRDADADFFVDTMGRLWRPEEPLDDAPARAGRLEEFPEMRPPETGHTAVRDIYAFYSVLTLRYAVLCAGSGDAAEAEHCGHVVLTAMGQMQQNVAGSRFYEDELAWQRRSVPLGGETVDAAALRADCVRTGRARLDAVLARLK
ncbi:hypothetical protein [Streptomyces griseosporeus]|uniref:hypothetical protein n=1 Tax=Streptomyces griseosporeus TaxID=1910 RepID=UPI001998F7B4|nr:hypothetical protein [Streptomyces griseosporeus]GHF77825.1 hypothetical protein GCM10018783_55010 [Streptomyces griseosporeus]